jgi:hypothetical protein
MAYERVIPTYNTQEAITFPSEELYSYYFPSGMTDPITFHVALHYYLNFKIKTKPAHSEWSQIKLNKAEVSIMKDFSYPVL